MCRSVAAVLGRSVEGGGMRVVTARLAPVGRMVTVLSLWIHLKYEKELCSISLHYILEYISLSACNKETYVIKDMVDISRVTVHVDVIMRALIDSYIEF